MRSYLLIQLFLIWGLSVSGQTRQLLVQWNIDGTTGKMLNSELPLFGLASRKLIVPDAGIELLIFVDEAKANLAAHQLASNPIVLHVQRDRTVDFRNQPNDAQYWRQANNLDRTGFTDAWNLTTGGQTPDGHDIVIAVLDGGFQTNHPDLKANLWTNPAEIPDDGRDNDGNGYVDDRYGWNMVDGTQRLKVGTHGTQVIGTLGAVGDNELGITGTNWNTKMMLFSIQRESQIIEAYEYVRQQRKLWNETQGREGAFVVATNASFGVEGGTCDQYPLWGAMYDKLGAEGILTAAATANFSWDVDERGDMPSDCETDYLLSVANVDTLDRLYRMSAYGRENVDLGAPGEGSYSTLPGNQFGGFGNTSAAAPYVTGAIALLYSSPCPSFHDKVKTDPAEAALMIRDVLLAGTKTLPSLEFRTSSGGMLNVAKSQELLIELCEDGEESELAVANVSPNPTSDFTVITLNKLVISNEVSVRVFDLNGRLVSTQRPIRIPGTPVQLGVNLGELPSGYYQVMVIEREESTTTRVIVH
ncbi:S8 family peptidase [Lewinella sp. 4G2]|uniref:S8 family peptidase n=1 Tax=Lewinella sp. 4G2 TaxID=1803372 RepID=UPI0018D378A6|nr:S8 family peptidase [Lewinella sp. 4G2]